MNNPEIISDEDIDAEMEAMFAEAEVKQKTGSMSNWMAEIIEPDPYKRRISAGLKKKPEYKNSIDAKEISKRRKKTKSQKAARKRTRR